MPRYVIISTRAGVIMQAGSHPSRFCVLDRDGNEVTEPPRVDMGAAFRALAELSRQTTNADARSTWP